MTANDKPGRVVIFQRHYAKKRQHDRYKHMRPLSQEMEEMLAQQNKKR